MVRRRTGPLPGNRAEETVGVHLGVRDDRDSSLRPPHTHHHSHRRLPDHRWTRGRRGRRSGPQKSRWSRTRAGVRPVVVRGSSTLADIQAQGGDLAPLLAEFGIPADTAAHTRLRELTEVYGFTIEDVRAYLADTGQ